VASSSFKILEHVNGLATIYLFFNYGKKKVVRYKTDVSVKDAKNWNKTNQRIKVNKNESHAIEKNKGLDKFNQYVEELIYNYDQNQTELDSDRIKFDLAL